MNNKFKVFKLKSKDEHVPNEIKLLRWSSVFNRLELQPRLFTLGNSA